jgi:hypothetical protein
VSPDKLVYVAKIGKFFAKQDKAEAREAIEDYFRKSWPPGCGRGFSPLKNGGMSA